LLRNIQKRNKKKTRGRTGGEKEKKKTEETKPFFLDEPRCFCFKTKTAWAYQKNVALSSPFFVLLFFSPNALVDFFELRFWTFRNRGRSKT
jgi:hypothetical protein